MAALQDDKHEVFATEYLVDLNGTQAAIRAGYSPDSAHVQSSRLLSNANIRTRIRELMDERSKVTLVDAEFVVGELLNVARRCQQAEPVMTFNYETKEMEETGEYKFDSIGANKALELLGKHVGMFSEKLAVTGVVSGGVNNEQFLALLAAARSNATTPGQGE